MTRDRNVHPSPEEPEQRPKTLDSRRRFEKSAADARARRAQTSNVHASPEEPRPRDTNTYQAPTGDIVTISDAAGTSGHTHEPREASDA